MSRDWAADLTDGFIACFGAWTFCCHICWMFNLSFMTLQWLALPGLIAGLLLARHWRQRPGAVPTPVSTSLVLAFYCIAATVIVLLVHRPDGDDAYYVGMGLAVLETPEAPLQSVFGSYWESHYGMTSYELLRATIAFWSPLPLLSVWYLWAPALLAPLIVLANYRLLRYWRPELALLASAVLLVVFLTWADVHRSHANFGFARLFQGKAALVSLVVPLVVLWSLQMVRDKTAWDQGRLGLVIVCGIGFSPTGLVVPLLAAMLVFASDFVRSPGQVFMLSVRRLHVLIYPTIVALFVFWSKGTVLRVGSDELGRLIVSDNMVANLQLVFGGGLRGAIALAAVALLPAVIPAAHRAAAIAWCLVSALVLFNPWSSAFFRVLIADSMAWRLWWSLPLPAITALVLTWLAGKAVRRDTLTRRGLIATFTLAMLYALLPGAWVMSEANNARLAWPPRARLENPGRLPHRAHGHELVVLNGRVCSERVDRCF